jgi:hypothetical protein
MTTVPDMSSPVMRSGPVFGPELMLLSGALLLLAASFANADAPSSTTTFVVSAIVCDAGILVIAAAVGLAFRDISLRDYGSATTRATWLTGMSAAMLATALVCTSNVVGAASVDVLFSFELPAFGVVGALWLVEFAACVFTLPEGRSVRAVILRLTMPVVLVVCTGFAVLTGAASSTSYLISRPAMDRYAMSMASTSGSPASGVVVVDDVPSRIGLLPIDTVERYEGGLRLVVSGAGFFSREGYAYSSSGQPPSMGDDWYWRVSEHWWKWTEDD